MGIAGGKISDSWRERPRRGIECSRGSECVEISDTVDGGREAGVALVVVQQASGSREHQGGLSSFRHAPHSNGSWSRIAAVAPLSSQY